MRPVLLLILVLFLQPYVLEAQESTYESLFDGAIAMEHLEAQCAFGPRPPGSENLDLCRSYIISHLENEGWAVELQNFTYRETQCSNIIARWGVNESISFIFGAHYDTRPHADRDPSPSNRTRPILGANDGASGVAVLLELARVIPESNRSGLVMVFFDAEDSGSIDGWDWIVGSTYYVEQMTAFQKETVQGMILVDMVGDADLRLLKETTSTQSLQNTIWSFAAELGYQEIFLDSVGAPILDDHRPFLAAGIPALVIIQHAPFPWYWHTLEDTPDKCSGDSLEVVGTVLEYFWITRSGTPFTLNGQQSTLIILVILLIPPVILVIYSVKYHRS